MHNSFTLHCRDYLNMHSEKTSPDHHGQKLPSGAREEQPPKPPASESASAPGRPRPAGAARLPQTEFRPDHSCRTGMQGPERQEALGARMNIIG